MKNMNAHLLPHAHAHDARGKQMHPEATTPGMFTHTVSELRNTPIGDDRPSGVFRS